MQWKTKSPLAAVHGWVMSCFLFIFIKVCTGKSASMGHLLYKMLSNGIWQQQDLCLQWENMQGTGLHWGSSISYPLVPAHTLTAVTQLHAVPLVLHSRPQSLVCLRVTLGYNSRGFSIEDFWVWSLWAEAGILAQWLDRNDYSILQPFSIYLMCMLAPQLHKKIENLIPWTLCL